MATDLLTGEAYSPTGEDVTRSNRNLTARRGISHCNSADVRKMRLHIAKERFADLKHRKHTRRRY